MRFKVIILDFDGVLVESNEIKDKAFEHVFAAYPQHLPAILEYHRRTSLIRFGKFRHIYENILRRPYTPQDEQRLGAEFSKYCIEQVVLCPWVKGAPQFLKFFKGRVPMYIASINPPQDMEAILKARGIDGYFEKVYTVTADKSGALKEVLARHNAVGTEAVFIGDSNGDAGSARKAGVFFMGRNSGLDLKAGDFPVFDDMLKVLEYLQKAT